ncbi:MAG: hypothetical protein GY775_19470, partial [Candidatus Scalindua sp.]|nr:hypothetical protein [Candidatus Scalindua sp.]
MKDSLEIHPPKGYEIDLDASDLSKNIIKFKEKSIKLPTTNNECVPFLPKKCYFIDSHGIIVSLWDNPNIYAKDLNTITSKEYAEAFSALMQLIKFRDIWNEGW